MATVLTPNTLNTSKVRFAHRYKMVVQKPLADVQVISHRSRIWAEAPDAGSRRNQPEAGEMWTRNAEAPDAGCGRS
ncbi:MAG: hypothetical protein RJA81_792 [Planctomycetota bacterium]|jgi:hypothetical protein